MLLAPVRLQLTTLVLLAPRSDQLSYRALFEEHAKSSQLRGWKRREIKDSSLSSTCHYGTTREAGACATSHCKHYTFQSFRSET